MSAWNRGKTQTRHINVGTAFGQQQKNLIHHDDSHIKGTKGLNNLGNTCYMNAAIQCLFHTEDLRKYFLQDDRGIEINRNNPEKSEGNNMAKEFRHLIKNLCNGQGKIYPSELKCAVANEDALFSDYSQ